MSRFFFGQLVNALLDLCFEGVGQFMVFAVVLKRNVGRLHKALGWLGESLRRKGCGRVQHLVFFTHILQPRLHLERLACSPL